MKSSQQELSNRGYLEKGIISSNSATREELFTQLTNSEPVQRSLAARELGNRFILVAGTAEVLLEHLILEKKLYTRLEICQALAKGDALTVYAMIPYLNTIGNSQYRSIAEAKTSKKKSYPLPRGIVARTLGNMGAFAADILLENLKQKEYAAEMIEGLGYLTYNKPELQTQENYERAKGYYELYKEDLLFVWKFVIFSSAFPYTYTEPTLTEIGRQFSEEAIQQELKRTVVVCKRH
ncbi:hypothetical protein I6N96_00330 [Enterococcus sp. BWM-S5]|uniref:Uncharacterized protein n=1 Tax=Enterococcus larvae TaxID=2794352 RepID=A0ABS4CFK3_9ENTE|nr:hypothetical protein [Enterococcus larvae]MBP1044707.1 hypothetical protein [Enterococcus larvae]